MPGASPPGPTAAPGAGRDAAARAASERGPGRLSESPGARPGSGPHAPPVGAPLLGIVLAAGRGERMRPLSDERPKAVLPRLDVPQLGWALAALRAAGVARAWVNARRDTPAIAREAERAARLLGMTVGLSVEPDEPLGTAGALRRLAAELDTTFVLVNADVACDLDLRRLVERHRASGAEATLVGIRTPDRADLVAEGGWVTRLLDRRERVGPGHVYAGVGAFEPSVLRHVPEGVSHLFDTVLCGAAREGGLAVLEWRGYWADVADPAAHLRVNLDGLSGPVTAPGAAALRPAPVRHDLGGYVGAGARVEGADVRGSVVGAGATVPPGTLLERCVVWDGAVVPPGVHRHAVVTPRRVVSVGADGR